MMASQNNGAERPEPESNTVLTELARQAGLSADNITCERLSEWFRHGMCPPSASNTAADRMALLMSPANSYTLADITPAGETVWTTSELSNSPMARITIGQLAQLWRSQPKDERPLFPLTPVVRAFLEEPRAIQPATRQAKRIIPAKLAMVSPGDPRANIFSTAAHAQKQGREQLIMPGFEKKNTVTPVLPLLLYDLGGGETNSPGPGAPLALRLFVESILAVQLSDRTEEGLVELSIPLRMLLSWLYPGGRRPRPSEYWPRLCRAAEILELPETRIPWYDYEKGLGGQRRVVSVGNIPRGPNCLDDEVQIIVNLPPGSEAGPQVSDNLRYYGVKSAIAYRLLLHFAYRWHHPGRTISPASNGKGRKPHWVRVYDPDRYERTTDEELLQMAFPYTAANNQRKLLQRARYWRDVLVKAGEMQIVDGKILPPQQKS